MRGKERRKDERKGGEERKCPVSLGLQDHLVVLLVLVLLHGSLSCSAL